MVIVLVPLAKPGALAVTVAVPVSDSDCMKNALVDDCPAGIVTGMLAPPTIVPLVDSNTLLVSKLVNVTTKPPAGAGAPKVNDACTCKSLPIVCALTEIAGAVTVAVA